MVLQKRNYKEELTPKTKKKRNTTKTRGHKASQSIVTLNKKLLNTSCILESLCLSGKIWTFRSGFKEYVIKRSQRALSNPCDSIIVKLYFFN